MKIKFERTERGFGLFVFTDKYDQICTIQDSSLATEPAIWFGVTNTGPSLIKKAENVRMHLTQEMVKELLPILTKFAETGEYISPDNLSD